MYFASRVARNRHGSRPICIPCFAALIAVAQPIRAQSADSAQPPLTLRALFDSVRNGHPSIRATDSRVIAAAGSLVAARALGNPIAAYQVDHTPFPGGQPSSGMTREVMATATLPLETLYQRGPRVTRANAAVRLAEEDAKSARQRLGLDAAAAYYRASLAQIQSATTRDLLGWLESLVDYNRARVNEGVAAEADLIRSELERDRVASEASMQDAELAQARAALGAFISETSLARSSDAVATEDMPLPLRAADASRPAQTSSGSRTTLSLFSIDARPDVRAARERLAVSTAAIAAERSMLVRQLGATIGTRQSGGMTSMIAGVSLALPLFDQNRGETQRARAERDAVAFELVAQERMATADIRGAYDAARVLAGRSALLARRDSTSLLARAEESRRIALGAYREGAVPLFQVLDAARAWAEARMTFYKLIAAQQQSVLALLVAQGFDVLTTAPAPLTAGELSR